MIQKFKLHSPFKPSGDQPEAIRKLEEGIKRGAAHQVLLGVTGSGKTFAIANLIERIQKPTLIISPNKTLAAQLYAEFKAFFPKNAVEYFISYYDYYQPEAYVPQTDTYIEKDASINEHIDRLRLKATSSLLERKDVIVVASVSCIYNLGSPEEYKEMCVRIIKGDTVTRQKLLGDLVSIHYERNDIAFSRGKFRVRGEIIEIFPAYLETAVKVEFLGDKIESILEINPLTGENINEKEQVYIYPAKHFVTTRPKIEAAIKTIKAELADRLAVLKGNGKLLEAQRLEQRTRYDMEMLEETGFCHGVENYSRHLSGKPAGSRTWTLIDYFRKNPGQSSEDFLTVIDESHIAVPQIRGMYEGDRSRKQTLVDFGFRLPSALDNRPLRFDEFESIVQKTIYTSATPANYELGKARGEVVDLVIRPTGLVDPEVIVRPIENQINDLMEEIKICVKQKSRALVTTLTKRMAEDLTEFLAGKGFKVQYIHSEVDAFSRIDILKDLRLGNFDVLVRINLLREGLDLPEVALVAVLDADKEGFLRSDTTLIQICGRAARNLKSKVILYADIMTGSMKRAMDEMSRRRVKQTAYNKEHSITPRSIVRAVHDLDEFQYTARREGLTDMIGQTKGEYLDPKGMSTLIKSIEQQMRNAADNLDFETAAVFRDRLIELREMGASEPGKLTKKKTGRKTEKK